MMAIGMRQPQAIPAAQLTLGLVPRCRFGIDDVSVRRSDQVSARGDRSRWHDREGQRIWPLHLDIAHRMFPETGRALLILASEEHDPGPAKMIIAVTDARYEFVIVSPPSIRTGRWCCARPHRRANIRQYSSVTEIVSTSAVSSAYCGPTRSANAPSANTAAA